MKINDAEIERLTQISNYPGVMKYCEPDIMSPFKLEKWMVKRSLVSEKIWKQVKRELKKRLDSK